MDPTEDALRAFLRLQNVMAWYQAILGYNGAPEPRKCWFCARPIVGSARVMSAGKTMHLDCDRLNALDWRTENA